MQVDLPGKPETVPTASADAPEPQTKPSETNSDWSAPGQRGVAPIKKE